MPHYGRVSKPFAGLRWLTGAEPGSPIGNIADWDPTAGLGERAKESWEGLVKAPETRVPLQRPPVAAPPMFQSPAIATPPAPPMAGSTANNIVSGPGAPWQRQEIMGGSMSRGVEAPTMPGSPDLSGLRANATRVPAGRPLEELRKFSAGGFGMAPGAQMAAQQQLSDVLGDAEFEKLMARKEQEIPRVAGAELHPSVQRQQELAARRAAYPSQAQAQGLQNQALYNFLGRRETAAGAVESRRATRDASALNTLERAMSAITEREGLTPEDNAELNRLRESIELVRRGVFFASDLFDESELDQLADLEQSFGIDEQP